MISTLNLITGDTFNRATGDLNGSTTDTGHSYTWNANVTIDVDGAGNAYRNAVGGGPNGFVDGLLIDDLEVSCTLVELPTNGGFSGVIARHGAGASSYLWLRVSSSAIAQVLRVGTPSATVISAISIDAGDRIAMRVVGDQVTVMCNDVVMETGTIPTDDQYPTYRQTGIRFQGGTGTTTGLLTDFKVAAIFPTTYLGSTPVKGAYAGTQIVRSIR